MDTNTAIRIPASVQALYYSDAVDQAVEHEGVRNITDEAAKAIAENFIHGIADACAFARLFAGEWVSTDDVLEDINVTIAESRNEWDEANYAALHMLANWAKNSTD